MSVCFLPYSKELLSCECHLVPSHCHDCKTELQTLISSCFLLRLNFLNVHRGFKMVKCNCVLVLWCQISALKVFSFVPFLAFFLATHHWASTWKSFGFECCLSCEIRTWVAQGSFVRAFLKLFSTAFWRPEKYLLAWLYLFKAVTNFWAPSSLTPVSDSSEKVN